MTRIGECDCCTRAPRVLHSVTAYGMDTAACAECLGGTAQDVADELADANEEAREAAEPGLNSFSDYHFAFDSSSWT